MVKAIDTDRFSNPSIRIEKGEEQEREGKKTKMHFGAFRRMSNFVHERACFAGGIGGIKERNMTTRKRAPLYDSAFKNGRNVTGAWRR